MPRVATADWCTIGIMEKYICIHGHFYQPPRMNPWLESLETQDSAYPYDNWNSRITAECYAPNAVARLLGTTGTIVDIVNNYSRISFNFGPTLLSWLKANNPWVHEALVLADQASQKRLGKGNALAQVYNHIIMPLATQRDKLTQIRWGIKDFEKRFARKPEGMWLSETAVDTPTLTALADEGILFTILAPEQAEHVRPLGGDEWQDVTGGKVDPKSPYLVNLPNGKTITVFFYDGPTSRGIAFEKLLSNGDLLSSRLTKLFDPKGPQAQLAHIATDGESYGHHHQFGEMALAYSLKELDDDPEYRLTNYAAFLATHPPLHEVRIRENSSWSCAHGIGRWKEDCGCAIDPQKGWNQKWRKPLREALDYLKSRLDEFFEQKGGELFKDPWAARDDYVEVMGPKEPEAWSGFLKRHLAAEPEADTALQAAKLLESQRWGLFMFTSCGWFFDDLAGLEPVQNLRFAARAMELAGELGAGSWEEPFLRILEQGSSNEALFGTGRDIWEKRVVKRRVTPARVVAHAALSSLHQDHGLAGGIYAYDIESPYQEKWDQGNFKVSWGRAKVTHRPVGEEAQYCYAVLHAGELDFRARVAPCSDNHDLTALAREIKKPMGEEDAAGVENVFDRHLSGERFGLANLFLEGRRKLGRAALDRATEENLKQAKEMYRQSADVMIGLRQMDVPLPEIYLALAEAILTRDLIDQLKEPGERDLSDAMIRVAQQVLALELKLDSPVLKLALAKAVARCLTEYKPDKASEERLAWAGNLVILARTLEIPLNLWEAQNDFFKVLKDRGPTGLTPAMQRMGSLLDFELGVS